MTTPTPSGPITAGRDIVAHTINTGHITQDTHLHIHVIEERLEQLAGLLAQPDATLQPSASGSLEVTARTHESLLLPENLLRAWHLLPQAVDARLELRRRAYAAWLLTQRPTRSSQEVAARQHYVPLAGWVNLHDLHFTERRWLGDGPQRQLTRHPLPDITAAVQQHPAFVLLGPPGCGKSTVLRRLALETARAVLTDQDQRLPIRLNLATYPWPHSDPLAFVSQHWSHAGLPGDFSSAVRAGEVFLLADGFNEMARLERDSELRRRANTWQDFLQTYFADTNNRSRAIIASRDQADYDQPLDLPRVEIDPLSEAQITAFLRAYLGEQAEGAWTALHRLGLLEHARNPYQLAVLATLYDPQGGDLPPNRGRLFAEYAVELLKREENANHPHWVRPEVQLAALSHLGYAMQAQSDSTVLSRDRVLNLLPQTLPVTGRPLHKEGIKYRSCASPPCKQSVEQCVLE